MESKITSFLIYIVNKGVFTYSMFPDQNSIQDCACAQTVLHYWYIKFCDIV